MNAVAELLPAHLSERCCQPSAVATDGELVLYWMRGSLRAEENPALDAAREAACALDLPLLVYQGLDERHPYANDRHHTFVLEGAREVGRALEQRGLRYALHVTRPGHRQPALRELGRRAALVVTERVPVPPLVEWTARLRTGIAAPVVEVDAACVVPLPLVERMPSRAFGFRKATEKLRRARLAAPWPTCHAEPRRFEGVLPFEPVDLEAVELTDLVGACEIDHAVGPVPGERGGTRAGDARWEAFRDGALATYDRTRNDALLDGVSRLSPYLHHGMVSPLRVAREAAAHGSKGAGKWLDELLVWRELAWAWCHHRDGDVERLDAVPEWARETLAAHAEDPRELRTTEALTRARSGDALWDAAQTSLLVRGELHNNVRMTWGKLLLAWSPTPEGALQRLIDLNHRFALDGRDPSSYGGLLWCLGLFDRPFVPEVPVFGSLRPRDTEIHARRLDPPTYLARVSRPGDGEPLEVAVIGGGVAGLSAARALLDAGHRPTVFDKGRGPGGRISTRRTEPFAFDHGAQYFTARDRRFRRAVEGWREEGVVAEWAGRIVALDGPLGTGTAPADKSDAERLVGTPGMSAIARHLAADLDVRSGVRVADLRPDEGGWRLFADEQADLGRFHAVVCSLPAEQAAELLASAAPALARRAAAVAMQPVIAVLLGLEAPLDVDFDGAFVNAGPLSWIARDSSKPGRPAHEAWVLHAGPDFSRAHWDADREPTIELLLAEFARIIGTPPPATAHRDLHRWRYALAPTPLDPSESGGCLADDPAGLILCGDWCAGSRLEGAFLSGQAAAGRLLRRWRIRV